MSSPQVGIQIADTINNNDTGGGNVKNPQADLSNGTGSVPGNGYPYCVFPPFFSLEWLLFGKALMVIFCLFYVNCSGDYYEQHSNDSSPTSPSISGGSMNLENSTLAPSPCDANRGGESSQENTPTNAPPANGPSDSNANSINWKLKWMRGSESLISLFQYSAMLE